MDNKPSHATIPLIAASALCRNFEFNDGNPTRNA